ncbi:MAG: ParB/RepB/Spo0J family partition protein [Alphaproteobacteria bacterium]|nr:ParB/RepB/Spo0J family partition protein [Alphaproteobacteria bacterium]
MNNKKFGLGRGLEALLGEDDVDFETDKSKSIDYFVENTVFKNENSNEISVESIAPCQFQPRTEFNAEALETLAASIKEKGVLQPLLLRSKGEKYEIIAGERRWRAAKMAGLKTVPAIIKDLNDQETLEIALIENLQREDLSAVEEAEAFDKLVREHEYTQEALAKIIGKSRSYIANTLRLLTLPAEIKNLVKTNKLSAGHARALVGYADAVNLAQEIIADGLSVRETEARVSGIKNKKNTKVKQPKIIDFDMKEIMRDLEQKLNLKVKINTGKNGKGSVTLKYNNPAELCSILDLLEKR